MNLYAVAIRRTASRAPCRRQYVVLAHDAEFAKHLAVEVYCHHHGMKPDEVWIYKCVETSRDVESSPGFVIQGV